MDGAEEVHVMTTCSGCEHLMLGKWAPWCHKANKPLLAVPSCPFGRRPVYFEPMDVNALVEATKHATSKGMAAPEGMWD